MFFSDVKDRFMLFQLNQADSLNDFDNDCQSAPCCVFNFPLSFEALEKTGSSWGHWTQRLSVDTGEKVDGS